MTNKVSSIQIIGTQRSGSNLLRLMLNQFDEVSAPHPPHVLRTFSPLLNHYNSLEIQENFILLANDIAEFVNANPVPWYKEPIQAIELIDRARHKSLLSLYEALYTLKAEHDNAVIWCCKSMFNEYYAQEIDAEGISPLYIYIYRDGRDVAASFKNAVVGPKHIFVIASNWHKDQVKAAQIESVVGSHRFLRIKYEDLILDTENVLRSVSDKLGLNYSTKLLNYYNSSESKKTAASGDMWKNVAKPIIKDNIGKYKAELTTSEIELFENIARKSLLKLGYLPDTTLSQNQKTYSEDEIAHFTNENTIMQKESRARASQHDIKLRSKQEDVVDQINSRFK